MSEIQSFFKGNSALRQSEQRDCALGNPLVAAVAAVLVRCPLDWKIIASPAGFFPPTCPPVGGMVPQGEH